MERIHPDKLDEWKFHLEAPLPGREKKVTPMMEEDEGASFMAMMAQVKGRG